MSNKLDRRNYLLWPSKFEPLLLSHDLIGFVDGSIPCAEQYKPEKDTKPISAVNPNIGSTRVEFVKLDSSYPF